MLNNKNCGITTEFQKSENNSRYFPLDVYMMQQ